MKALVGADSIDAIAKLLEQQVYYFKAMQPNNKTEDKKQARFDYQGFVYGFSIKPNAFNNWQEFKVYDQNINQLAELFNQSVGNPLPDILTNASFLKDDKTLDDIYLAATFKNLKKLSQHPKIGESSKMQEIVNILNKPNQDSYRQLMDMALKVKEFRPDKKISGAKVRKALRSKKESAQNIKDDLFDLIKRSVSSTDYRPNLKDLLELNKQIHDLVTRAENLPETKSRAIFKLK